MLTSQILEVAKSSVEVKVFRILCLVQNKHHKEYDDQRIRDLKYHKTIIPSLLPSKIGNGLSMKETLLYTIHPCMMTEFI